MRLIDLDAVIRNKVPQHYAKVPKWLIRFAAWLICQDDMNRTLTSLNGVQGPDFAAGMCKQLNVHYNVQGIDNLPSQGRYIFVSNHPLGAFDGISYINILGHRYPKFKVIVNDLLMYIEALQPNFLPVNTLGKQKRSDMTAVQSAYADTDTQILTFPAGFCSRFIGGRIQDVAWKKSVITQAIESQRDIIPMHFEGRNSLFFYTLEWLRRKAGIKFNIGLILLPRQMMRTSRNKTYTVRIGKPIPWQTFLNAERTPQQWAEWLRQQSYALTTNKL